ncbi:PREDICTED: transmembrane protein 141 isoform X3 [Chinchilla lanigera]|uniref:transmembrane protein 141 isoform X3 n=1 Tax=Chinchilla lanigera TaxID=34839 RepID=UPI000697F024|nr:PREDICTED: transmembrane protein 141 isoform X3 [Chinchilla lanigera]
MVNLGLSRVDDAVAAKHPVGSCRCPGLENAPSCLTLPPQQAPAGPSACRFSSRESSPTRCSGASWQPWVSPDRRAAARAQIRGRRSPGTQSLAPPTPDHLIHT